MRQLLRITATFALALVFSAGMAFGQAAQNGDIPSDEGQDNASVIKQVDNQNEATIDQVGVGNASLLSQGGASNLPETGHTVTIQQQGNNNYTNIFQQANATGHSEVSVQLQGSGNTVSRSGTRSGSDNDVRVAGGSDYTVQALGNNNTVTSPVIEASDVDVILEGSNNDITARSQAQSFANPRDYMTSSSIEVLGSQNTVSVEQGTVSFGGNSTVLPAPDLNFSSVQVEGNFNTANVRQSAGDSAGNTFISPLNLDPLSSGFTSP